MKRKINEKILLYKVRTKKDPEAFGQLYDLYIDKIYRFVYFKVNSKEDTEDITSAVFLKVWGYLIEYTEKEIDSFSGLVYRIARNAVIDFYRSRAIHKEYPIDILEETPTDDNNYHKVEVNQEVEKIMKDIKKLKYEYQEVLILKYVDELEIAEIAEILGRGQTNIRVIMHRAIKKLKEFQE
mgnify:CR=1 FL=1